jgi:hypothetical protein
MSASARMSLADESGKRHRTFPPSKLRWPGTLNTL